MSGLASIPELLVLHAKERGQKVAFSGPGHAIVRLGSGSVPLISNPFGNYDLQRGRMRHMNPRNRKTEDSDGARIGEHLHLSNPQQFFFLRDD